MEKELQNKFDIKRYCVLDRRDNTDYLFLYLEERISKFVRIIVLCNSQPSSIFLNFYFCINFFNDLL